MSKRENWREIKRAAARLHSIADKLEATTDSGVLVFRWADRVEVARCLIEAGISCFDGATAALSSGKPTTDERRLAQTRRAIGGEIRAGLGPSQALN